MILEILPLPKLPICEDLLKDYLSPGEVSHFQKLRHPKRRREWLGGRMAAKKLLEERTGIKKDQIELLPNTRGKPEPYYLKKRLPYELSISHSGEYAAAAIGKVPLGLDLEKVEPRHPAWLAVAFRQEELERFPQDIFSHTSLWTAKESVLKALGCGLQADLWDISLSGSLAYLQVSISGYAQQLQQHLPGPLHCRVFVPMPDYRLGVSWTAPFFKTTYEWDSPFLKLTGIGTGGSSPWTN